MSEALKEFIVSFGYSVDEPSKARAERKMAETEKAVTDANIAGAARRIEADRQANIARIAAAAAAGKALTDEEKKTLIAADAERRAAREREAKARQSDRDKVAKEQSEDVRKQKAAQEEAFKRAQVQALRITTLAAKTLLAFDFAKVVDKLTFGAFGKLSEAAQGLERMHYAAANSGNSVRGLQAFGFAVAQMGGNADAAQRSLESFGRALLTYPQFEATLKSMGVATRDSNGQLRAREEILADLAEKEKGWGRAQREAFNSRFGIDDDSTQAMLRPGFRMEMDRERERQARIGADADAAGDKGSAFGRSARTLEDALAGIKQRVEGNLFDIIRPKLDAVAKWIEEHGDQISTFVNKLTNGLSDLATAFAQSPFIRSGLDGLGDGLHSLAGYINSDQFRSDMKGFASDVMSIAKALRWALEKLGILPSTASAAVVPDPKGTFDDHEFSGGGANLRNRRSHNEHQNVDNDHAARVRGQEDSFTAAVPTGAHTPLKDLIAQHETGSTGAASYDTVYGHAEQPGSKMAAFAPPKPITQMTIGEILAYQRDMKARAHSDAFPVGRAQWVEHTLRGLTAGMDKNTIFTPEVQERLFDKSIAGRIGQGPNGFRNEWASLGGIDDATIGGAIEGHRKAMAQASPQSGGKGTYPDWMDDRSKREIAAINAPLARDLLAAAEATGMRFKVAQGMRTQAEANANAQSGRGVRNSQHLYGAAADIHLLDANGNVTYDRAAYQKFAEAYTAHSQVSGGQGRWLGNLGGRWGADIVHFDQGIGYGQTHQREPYGQGGPTKEDIAANNREIYASPQNPFLHGNPIIMRGQDVKSVLGGPQRTSALGDSPALRASISHMKGDTNVSHHQTFNVSGGDTKQNIETAGLIARRGTADLIRNVQGMEA